MYYQYFGLTEAPFSIAVNPRYLYMSPRHRDALAHLLYGIGEGGGFVLLTGEVGTGKTTINRCLLEQLPDDTDVAIILNPALSARELLATVCDELGIHYAATKPSLKELTDLLHQYLLDNHAQGRNTVLIIDEAQHLDFEVLEQIRLLTNLETNTRKLLQIILIGQPELVELLARPELRQLNQRITARYNLQPLDLAETRAYIQHRLRVAGLAPTSELFPPAITKGIYQYTRGIPRLINVLCDRTLLGVYGRNQSRADRKTLQAAAAEVLGESAGQKVTGTSWVWSAVAGSVLLVLIAGAWLWQQQATNPEPAVVASSPVVPAMQPEAEPTRSAPAPPVDEAQNTTRESTDRAPDWWLTPAEGEALLLRLALPDRPVAGGCPALTPPGPRCGGSTAQTWSDLSAADRLLLLSLITPGRMAFTALMLGIERDRGWFWLPGANGGELVSLELASVGALWDGDYRFVWQPPSGWRRPLARGYRGEDVAAVAQLFARLDGQPRALSQGDYNSALEQRVEVFQRNSGLEPDGVVGEQTLLRLNERAGVDRRASDIRRSMQAMGEIAGAGR